VAEEPINQRTLAEKLGVSFSTVSRCFTNHPAINAATRARVFALAAELGYKHPEKRPRERASGARITFGVLICVELPNSKNGEFGIAAQEILNGLSAMSRAFDVRLDLHFVNPRELHLDSPGYAAIMAEGRKLWDGVALIYSFPQTIIDELMAHYPVVSLVEQSASRHGPLNCVDLNHHAATGMLIDRLRNDGHERIGFFTWRYPVEAIWSLRRYSAFIEQMTMLDLTIHPHDVINAGPRHALPQDKAQMEAAQRTRDGVTAWICAADHQAYDLITYFRGVGLRVPQDVSIVAYDGMPCPEGLPQLTTVLVPHTEIGSIGGRRLMDLIEKRFGPTQHIMLHPRLREGESVAPRRSEAVAAR
jgi:LacI family transcriptional regulator